MERSFVAESIRVAARSSNKLALPNLRGTATHVPTVVPVTRQVRPERSTFGASKLEVRWRLMKEKSMVGCYK